MILRRIPLFVLPLVLIGCGGSGDHVSTETLPLAQVDPTTAGGIAGKVLFEGIPPTMPTIDMSATPSCERQHHAPQKAEQVIVNGNGTLRNAFVWIAEGLPKARWNAPSAPAHLDQDGCVYRPHVLGVMTGQEIEIDNSDPVNHNVHAESSINPAWNESQPPRAEKKFKRFDLQEVWFPVTCSVHPWMRSYLAVVAHPFFAVTGDDGTFALKGVPPGKYVVEAIHEKYGRKRIPITIGPKEDKTVDFSFAGAST